MASGDLRAARRYSKALFNLARERNELDEIDASLAVVTQTASASPELMTVLHHPLITRERKKEVLAQVFSGQIQPDVQNFLFLLVERDRASIIPNVAQEFARLVDEYRMVTDAEVVSAVPLSEEQQNAVVQRLQASTGYTIRLQTRVDENILGGLVIRVGDKLMDGSVATQLQKMREQLKQIKVS